MKKRQIIFSSFLGNTLEFYDFTLYGAFAIIIGQTFFPSTDPFSSLLQSLGVFASGFLMRPFGAAFFGAIGDKLGRKRALQLSILCIGLPTLLIAVMPSYEAIGWIAPALVIFCRLLQGLCTGGEYNGAAIFALEHVGKNNPGLVGGLITASCGVGALLAMAMGVLVHQPGSPTWAWRIPFFLGTFACLWGFHIRAKLEESPVFQKMQAKNEVVKTPLLHALTHHKKASLVTFLFGAADGGLAYLVFVFLSVFLETQRGFSPSFAHGITLVSILTFTLFAPTAGYLFDKDTKKRFLKYISLATLFLSVPGFYLLQYGNLFGITIALLLFAIFAAGITGPLHAFLQKLFPTQDRYSGISFCFSVGISVGGLTPYILTVLFEHFHSYLPLGLYTASWGIICYYAIYKASQKG